MRMLLIGAGALLLAGGAGAQVLGGGPGGQLSTNGIGGGASIGIGSPAADPGGLGTARQFTGEHVRDGAELAGGGKRVRVAAGASVRVGEGTRCYRGDHEFDPVYRDGAYYCERTGPAVAAGARARTGR